MPALAVGEIVGRTVVDWKTYDTTVEPFKSTIMRERRSDDCSRSSSGSQSVIWFLSSCTIAKAFRRSGRCSEPLCTTRTCKPIRLHIR